MTEQEWLTTEDPIDIYRLIENHRNKEVIFTSIGNEKKYFVEVSVRQILLWLAACIDLSKHDYSGTYYNEMYRRPWRAGDESPRFVSDYLNNLRLWCRKEDDKPGDPSLQLRTHLLRDVIGNPWRRVSPLDPQWLTPQVLSLAQAAWDDRPDDHPILDANRFLVLSDALKEAGAPETVRCQDKICRGRGRWTDAAGSMDYCSYCNSQGEYANPILAHLGTHHLHIRGCWALDLILGKE